MSDDAMRGREQEGRIGMDAEEIAREIDALMAPPPKGLPGILVFGDDAVFGITPARRPAGGR
ncbi:hypothetical protein [Phenylobacterium sp.]|uniref:hypothetical protein n=1 Tax=Phenylobacterium sp. TaxID=1871053 RepID=UPI0025FDDF05|nr:hypothetical protein [Phenylobacterium sp.]MBX3486159.1 hypothetical protein [Phenylobacterium sp.]MCW5760379.1 hypothetical protein [Phenylobacterium sp.]